MRLFSRTARVLALAAAASCIGFTSLSARADEETGSAFSGSAGVDFTSHFISYGADVWGGAYDISPFSAHSTAFAWTTVNIGLADNLSGFVNLWSDLNDNVDSNIGGPIQEVDFNVGVSYAIDKISLGAAYGMWMYAGDDERVIDLSIGYNDMGMIKEGFALNPSFVAHFRVAGNGAQDDGVAGVFGIKPSWTLNPGSKYPVTVYAPISVALFSIAFQGGDSIYGYASAGLGASVPLAFIPLKYGAWTASAQVQYYNTPSDSLPGNDAENFFVTTLSTAVSW